MMVEAATLSRNYRLIEQKMKAQTTASLNYGSEIIEQDLKKQGFLTGLFVKPAVKFFYEHYAKNKLKKSAITQLYITLDTAQEIVERDLEEDEPAFRGVIDTHFPDYLENDSNVVYCKSKHANYPKLERLTRETFISQVSRVVKLLKVEQPAETYDDLIQFTFETREEARDALMEQLNFTEAGIATVESDPSILDIPTAKKLILRVLRKGFEQTKTQFLRDLETLYGAGSTRPHGQYEF